MKYGLKRETIKSIIQQLTANDKVREVILYGSRAMGTNKPNADIDLTLKGNSLTLLDIFAMENRVDDLLLPYQFDISNYDDIDNAGLLEHIESVGISLYKRPKGD